MRKSVKQLAAGIVSVVLVLSLTGCGSAYPDMTEEQEKAIGEYAAMTLLKYDAENRSRLVDASVVEAYEQRELEKKEQAAAMATPEPTPDVTKPTENNSSVGEMNGETVVQPAIISIEESLAAPEGISVAYQGYDICDTYPDDGSAGNYFTLDASQGQKLLVLKFRVSNESAEEKSVDFFSINSIYKIKTGGTEMQNAMTTLLEDDISTYAGKLEAGAHHELVLLFEVGSNIEEDNIQLYFKNESNEYTIQLAD